MTTATLAGLVLIGGFVLLLLMRVPISFAMLLATLGSALVTGTNFSVLVRQMVDGANNFSLLSIPFFIVMGEFMSAGGISEKIVDLANLAVGRFRGGLAYVNVLDSMFFGGISGSAVADVSSLGTIVIPMMGYFTSLELPKQAMSISLGRGMLFAICALLLLAFLFGESGIWISAVVSETCTLTLALLLYRRSIQNICGNARS